LAAPSSMFRKLALCTHFPSELLRISCTVKVEFAFSWLSMAKRINGSLSDRHRI
jgi:hypothetical protein